MKLLQNEQELASFADKRLKITNKRVYFVSVSTGRYEAYIFNRDIASIENLAKSNNWLLVLSVISALLGIYNFLGKNKYDDSFDKMTVIFIILFFVWMFFRKILIVITSTGGSAINVPVKFGNFETDAIIEKLNEVKDSEYEKAVNSQLNTNTPVEDK
jgi:hypothetical protein